MRTTITIFFVSIFVIFILVIVPSSQSSFALEDDFDQKGRVLGAAEDLFEDKFGQYQFEDLGFPEIGTRAEEPPQPAVPTKIVKAVSLQSFGCPVVVVDKSTSEVLHSEQEGRIVPIASITKLMTALVALDEIEKLDKYYKIKSSDMVAGGRYYLKTGDEVLVLDLLQLSLVASANSATQALVSASGLEREEFVVEMNAKAKALGLEKTNFFDSVGLSHRNQSNVQELAGLMIEASQNEIISEIIKKTKVDIQTRSGRKVVAYSTNNLLKKYPQEAIENSGGKTGHTNSAGYCLASSFTKEDNEVVTIVLGAQENYQRFRFTEKLVDWTYKNYIWK